jgi:hypothetical protein
MHVLASVGIVSFLVFIIFPVSDRQIIINSIVDMIQIYCRTRTGIHARKSLLLIRSSPLLTNLLSCFVKNSDSREIVRFPPLVISVSV